MRAHLVVAWLAAMALPVQAQGPATRVDIGPTFLRAELGKPAIQVGCSAYHKSRLLSGGCSWVSRNAAIATVSASGTLVSVTPHAIGETVVVATHSGQRDSVTVRVVRLEEIVLTPRAVLCEYATATFAGYCKATIP
jgi:hypothetical protein